ncbi:hypothetical protein [Catenulispora subtropica]|uniref:Uncharacterized protein n=1 Tax=Catenulispora subtropica TaxID=450798 RepID=A0ABN2SR97_9ACTN
MAENPVRTAIGYEFPKADWLDPFDVDETRTQWFFVNQDRISRAWVAPTGEDAWWGFARSERLWDVFDNPRSCLYCLEKLVIVSGGQVLREWSPTPLRQQPAPKSCAQHNGLFLLHGQEQQVFPVHEAPKYATYDAALAEALADREAGRITMIARVNEAQSLW